MGGYSPDGKRKRMKALIPGLRSTPESEHVL